MAVSSEVDTAAVRSLDQVHEIGSIRRSAACWISSVEPPSAHCLATFVPVQAHRRISTLQLVARLPGTIAGARRRFGGGASLCLHPGVARAVAAFTIELTRPDDCVSLAGGASRTPLRRQAPALTAAQGPGPFRSIASDRRPHSVPN